MTALIPVPSTVTTDAAAPPFLLAPASRLVAGPGARETADLAVSILHRATGCLLPVAGDPVAAPIDIVLIVAGHGAPESYSLSASSDGVRITGADEAGLFYGVQTLAQLLRPHGDTWASDAVQITDAPRFTHRGTMLDIARHFFPADVICRHIDNAAALKLNALHLHLTDDQGWRIALDSHPELTARGSATAMGDDAGGSLSKADYARIVAYAAARHMVVIPEIDGPSHTHAVGLSHPELAEAPVISDIVRETVRATGGDLPAAGVPFRGFAVGFSSLKIHDEATYDLLADVYGELAGMTPGPYLHVGGDEPHGTDPADFAEYMARVTRLVSDLGKTPIAWHEAGEAAGLSDDTIGQYWGFTTPVDGTDDKARAFVARGSTLILSPGDTTYLDMKYTDDSPLGLTWANGPTSVERAYRWEPTEVVPGLTEDDILGVEAPLWTETIRTPADIDTMVFPRLAAAAEIAWSPTPAAHADRTWESFRTRLAALAPLWTRQGIGFFRADGVPWDAADDAEATR